MRGWERERSLPSLRRADLGTGRAWAGSQAARRTDCPLGPGRWFGQLGQCCQAGRVLTQGGDVGLHVNSGAPCLPHSGAWVQVSETQPWSWSPGGSRWKEGGGRGGSGGVLRRVGRPGSGTATVPCRLPPGTLGPYLACLRPLPLGSSWPLPSVHQLHHQGGEVWWPGTGHWPTQCGQGPTEPIQPWTWGWGSAAPSPGLASDTGPGKPEVGHAAFSGLTTHCWPAGRWGPPHPASEMSPESEPDCKTGWPLPLGPGFPKCLWSPCRGGWRTPLAPRPLGCHGLNVRRDHLLSLLPSRSPPAPTP